MKQIEKEIIKSYKNGTICDKYQAQSHHNINLDTFKDPEFMIDTFKDPEFMIEYPASFKDTDHNDRQYKNQNPFRFIILS